MMATAPHVTSGLGLREFQTDGFLLTRVYKENVAVCSEIHTKHLNVLFRKNVDLLNVKPDGTHSNR